MVAAHVGGHGKGFPVLSYPELFRVTGPLLSLVLRTEDVWQRYNQYTKSVSGLSIRVSPSHSYNAGRAGLGWMSGCKCTLGWCCVLFFCNYVTRHG
jgi:hypothetical protein